MNEPDTSSTTDVQSAGMSATEEAGGVGMANFRQHETHLHLIERGKNCTGPVLLGTFQTSAAGDAVARGGRLGLDRTGLGAYFLY